jgi:hypothetical protein
VDTYAYFGDPVYIYSLKDGLFFTIFQTFMSGPPKDGPAAAVYWDASMASSRGRLLNELDAYGLVFADLNQ